MISDRDRRLISLRQRAQELVTAKVHADDDLVERLLGEAARDCPVEMALCLVNFIQLHTVEVDPDEADGRSWLDFLVRSCADGLVMIGKLRGGDTHEFVRGTLAAASVGSAPHTVAAQALVAASMANTPSGYDSVLDICAAAWQAVGSALLALWITCTIDAFPLCPVEPLLDGFLRGMCDVLGALANYTGCTIEQMVEGYWTALAQADSVR